MVVAVGEEAEAAGAEVAGVDEEIAVVAPVIAAAGAAAGTGAGAAGVVLALSTASHRHGSTLALVLLPVLLVPATHAGQNQSRRVT